MIFKRLYDERLAQACYLIACQRTKDAVIVDPGRDIGVCLEAAKAESVRIRHVTETHIHADFLSGARELAGAAGATLHLSDAGTDDWRYAFAGEANARRLVHGDRIDVGEVVLEVIHTPGHTPEHISFLVTDASVSPAPVGVLTGDFVFVGDVGRPDLLEKAAGMKGTMERSARQLYRSIRSFAEYPDYLQIWPGHGAGSACGKSLGAMPQSTLGFEKLTNWAFNATREEEFVATVTQGQPDPPLYFEVMKRLNRDGPPPRPAGEEIARLSAEEIGGASASGAQVVDVRPARNFAEGHRKGAINIPLNKAFANWAGAALEYDRDIVLLTAGGDERPAREARAALQLIGLDRVTGYGGAESSEAVSAGAAMEELESGGRVILDVRTSAEWNEGHIGGARHIALQRLRARLDELDPGQPVTVHCQGGGRSAIAASLLESRGFRDVRNFEAGFAGWKKSGMPVATGNDGGAAA